MTDTMDPALATGLRDRLTDLRRRHDEFTSELDEAIRALDRATEQPLPLEDGLANLGSTRTGVLIRVLGDWHYVERKSLIALLLKPWQTGHDQPAFWYTPGDGETWPTDTIF